MSRFNIEQEVDESTVNAPGLLFGGGVAVRVFPNMSAEIEAIQTDLGTIPNNLVSSRARSVVVRLNHDF